METIKLTDYNGREWEYDRENKEYFHIPNEAIFVDLGIDSLSKRLYASITKIYSEMIYEDSKRSGKGANWSGKTQPSGNIQYLKCEYDIGYLQNGDFIGDSEIEKSSLINSADVTKKIEDELESDFGTVRLKPIDDLDNS